ncbi:hypothetical protein Pmani_040137 [Petrolisthes manimaculis]|uniref:Uncharacterized protein n=1 Tax=Petrolisthes manimaculis TaxID=1843537 RepID=A0AAE1TIU7_9EUCA|nr:hypothetical protein Pmani_040137 [Petrolisthes manimaculis]
MRICGRVPVEGSEEKSRQQWKMRGISGGQSELHHFPPPAEGMGADPKPPQGQPPQEEDRQEQTRLSEVRQVVAGEAGGGRSLT